MLTAQSLSCRKGSHTIFRDIGFTVERGGFLLVKGANGSGKTSLLRLLAGLSHPTGGEILWHNKALHTDPSMFRRHFHYIGHRDAVKPELTVLEMMHLWCALRQSDSACAHQALERLALGSYATRAVKTLSAGQKRRLSLCRLFIDDAPLWLLDEPTTALDRPSNNLFWQQVTQHRARGGLVIAAMHDDLTLEHVQILELGQAQV